MTRSADRERILVVDDAPDTLEVLQRNLQSVGYRVVAVGNVADAIRILEAQPIDLVLTDVKMPKVSGLDLLRHTRENHPDAEVMMITGYATVEGAVEAVKAGAEEYLPKPFTSDELIAAVQRALDKLHRRRARARRPATNLLSSYGLIGASEPMQRLSVLIRKAASTPATVLVTGESGTGKELVARAIHYHSQRAAAPFVPVNCGGIPAGLIERELFGHLKGAFTGATASRAGFFQTAEGGSIFLDEISEMEVSLQVKLLRVLQEREICMVGDTRSRKADVRVIAATNKDLATLVRKGGFREDLYYRLNVLNIDAPPLRERGGDTSLLARHFAAKYAEEWGEPVPGFSDRAMSVMEGYDWPGNVRELENAVQRMVLMGESERIEVGDLPDTMRFSASRAADLHRTLAEVELEHIRLVLASAEGNKSRAARILGIDRKTLREKLKVTET